MWRPPLRRRGHLLGALAVGLALVSLASGFATALPPAADRSVSSVAFPRAAVVQESGASNSWAAAPSSPARSAPLLAPHLQGPDLLPSPLLGAYDPSALLVPVGGTHALYPQASLWNGTGGALVAGASLSWNVSPSSLGSISASGTFTAGPAPENGTVTVVASLNGTSASGQVPVTVYTPACILLSLDLPSRVSLETGSNLTLAPRWFDQTGSPCASTPQPAWTLWPSSFGELTSTAAGTATLHVNATLGDGWVNATATSAGASRTAILQVSAVPASAGAVLDISPQSARLSQGQTLSFSASVLDGWGTTPTGTYLWSLSPSSLGTIAPGGSSATFTAGSGTGTGWVNVTFFSSNWGVLTASAQVRDAGPPPPDPMTGLYAPYMQTPPLLPGQGVLLSLYGTDAVGGIPRGTLNVTWQVEPSTFGRVTPQGGGAVFVAGPRAGHGTVLAKVNWSGGTNLSVPFPVSIVPLGVSSVALYGAPSDSVPVGGFAYLEGVDQDLFGNLLLAGGFYGLQYAAMNVSWAVVPSTLGVMAPMGNGTSQDLPETAVFYAGGFPGSGEAVETLRWAGETQTVTFPLQVYAKVASAVALVPAATATPYGGVFENAPAVITALVLDQNGAPTYDQGNFTWRLAPGSDASFAGTNRRAQVTVTTGSSPGIVLGNLTWQDGPRSAVEEFLFDVIGPPTNATMIAITPGGASAEVDALLGSALLGPTSPSATIEPSGTAFTAGTTQVPGAQASVHWSLAPASFGTLSNTVGREVNVSLTGTSTQGWLNATLLGPDGTPFFASWPIFTYRPHLAYLQDLTGPCVGSCSMGVATFAGNNAFVGLAPFDQMGRPFGQVVWSGAISPSDLALPLWTGWSSGPGSELFEIEANATAGNATFTASATSGGESLSVQLPVVIVPSWLSVPPLAATGLFANASSNEVALNWTAPSNFGSGRFQNYTIQVVEGNGSAEQNLSDPTWTSFLFSPALPGTTYHFRVRAWNSLGLAGPWTPWIVATTWRAPPPGYPIGPSAEGYGATVFLLPVALAAAALVPLVGEFRRQRKARISRPNTAAAPPSAAPPPAPRGPEGPGH